jgi:geranylgeranyl pyrophosphate synthase/uncharacterized protein with NAD-binding domain and iron-sulfur cluster
MRKKVVIIGGGVAGMSAAQELIERGFAVEVFDRHGVPGGKARSVAVPGTRSRGARALPGEHGFRFFPGFYKHVIDTMERIPFGAGTVAANLVDTTQVHVARVGRPPVFYPARFPQTPGELWTAIHFVLGLLGSELDVPATETALFGEKIFQIVSSCEERRNTEYEKIPWSEFVEAAARSFAYRQFYANGFTRSLVAAKAQRASTKTIGDIFVQMLLTVAMPPTTADRVLNGPTSEVWIDPWLAHLKARGVVYHLGAEVTAIDYQRGAINGITAMRNGRFVRAEGDHYIAAVPVERLATLVTASMRSADPGLAGLSELSEYVEWMNGIQFYLTRDIPLVHGHSIYIDTPWALTSVSQPQFWPARPIAGYGDGHVHGILSVCVSDWDVPGFNGKKAEDCSRAEVEAEVWDQLKRSLNVGGRSVLSDDMLHSWYLDDSITSVDTRLPMVLSDAEPLLVNYVDTWRLRPEAVTRIPNLFLASDYVRTFTDIATMEGANEAARRAVNGVLDALGSTAPRCALWKLHEPDILSPLRAHDLERFRKGLPWSSGPLAPIDLGLSTANAVETTLRSDPSTAPIAAALGDLGRELLSATGGDVDLGSAGPAIVDPSALSAAEAPPAVTDSASSFRSRLESYRALVLPKLLSLVDNREPREYLYGLVGDHLRRGGKGLRSALCLATAAAYGGDTARALPSAAALEMLHNAFLVHDDIEDGSESRRGHRTMYVEHGLALAVNTGDAMQATAFRMLRENGAVLGPDQSELIADEFEHLVTESLEGQALELGWIRDNHCSFGDEDYLLLVLKKTCWYSFIHPCRIGALVAAGDAVDPDRFNRFGFLAGAAFQIQDDVLNLLGDDRIYGKEIGGDLWEGKRTLVLSHALRQASPQDRERLRDVLGRPREGRSTNDVAWVTDLLQRGGSIGFAQRSARELAQAAVGELAVAFADARPGPDLDFIRDLVRYTTERNL